MSKKWQYVQDSFYCKYEEITKMINSAATLGYEVVQFEKEYVHDGQWRIEVLYKKEVDENE